jgi:TonB family protein
MDIASQAEERNKKRGMYTSIAVHIGLLLLALLPLLTFPDPPPGQEGILVNLGLPDMGEGDDNAGPAEPTAPVEEVEPTPEPEATPPPVPETKKPEPVPQKEVIKTEDPDAVALRKERERQEAERKRQEQIEEQRRREEEARKRAEAEADAKRQAEADALKKELGGLFGDGGGKGNTGKPGNQGDPGGDPDASKLEGISTGSGSVGGGLGSRGVASAPKITDNSQQQGTVVVKVCVNSSGDVISAEFTQLGSTISDSRLKNLAVSNAQRWKFSPGSVDKQCGTITYRFRVQ